MHFALVQRALLWRLLVGILVVGGALLIHPRAILAQSDVAQRDGATPFPMNGLAPEVAPAANITGNEPGNEPVNESVASTPSDLTHVITAGDTLTNVAQRYGVEVSNLAAYNQIVDYNHIVLGQKLRIPPQGVVIAAPAVATLPGADGYHVVRQGEALGAIARRYGLTLEELLALNEVDDPNLVRMGTMLRLTADVEPATAVIQPTVNVQTYTVTRGDTLSEIAQRYGTTTRQMLEDNGLTDANVRVGQELKIYPPANAATVFGVNAPEDGARRIVIDLSDQTLTAYQGDVVVLYTYVSTGKAATPTVPGEFAIYQKLDSQHMTGDDYDLPGVPWVMYYYDEFAIHGAYWHANFGIPTSHGCTNMSIPESKALYAWAPLGTPVTVQQ